MEKLLLNRVAINPNIMGGKPVIKGTRIPLYIILQMLQDGLSFEEILSEYPKLTIEDVKAAIEYAIDRINDAEIGLNS